MTLTLKIEIKQGYGTIVKNDSYKEYKGEIIIPSVTEDNVLISKIASDAFLNCEGITKVILGDNIEEIGSSAFEGCSGLETMELSQKLTTIGKFAFYNCKQLSNIRFKEKDLENGKQSNLLGPHIKKVGRSAFQNCVSLKDIEFLYGISVVEDWTFSGCENLEKVTLADSVKAIGDQAFSGCFALSELNIFSSNIKLGHEVFYGVDTETCTLRYSSSSSLFGGDIQSEVKQWNEFKKREEQNFIWSKGIKYSLYTQPTEQQPELNPLCVEIADNGGNRNLSREVKIEEYFNYGNRICRVVGVGANAFSSHKSLTSITLPQSLTFIGEYAFSGCSSISSITLPNSLSSIGEYVFSDCSSLSSLILPNSITSIEEGAFYGCSSLSSLTLPNSITSIEEYAFRGCTKLSSLTLPDTIGSMEGGAFLNCTQLNTIYCYASIPPDITNSIGLNLGCVVVVPQGCVSHYQKAEGWKNGEFIFIDTIPKKFNDDRGILYNVIDFEKRLVEVPNQEVNVASNITIDNPVKGEQIVYDKIFYTVDSVGNIVWVTPIKDFEKEGIKYTVVSAKEKTVEVKSQKAPFVPKLNSKVSYNGFEFTVIKVGSLTPSFSEFESANFRYTILPSEKNEVGVGKGSVEPIGVVTIPKEVVYNGFSFTVYYINSEGFKNCTGLSSIDLPNSIRTTGREAFSGCTKLSSITLPNSLISIGGYTFHKCSSLSSLTLPNSITSIATAAFEDCNSLSSITLPNSLTSIGGYAFYKCSSLSSIILPNSLIAIGGLAFSGCTKLSSLTLPNSITYIGGEAFSSSTSLSVLTLPNSVTSIGAGAFEGCSSLSSTTLPNSIRVLGREAFRGCSALNSIQLPAQLPAIATQTFRGCRNLIAIALPDTISSIGEEAFLDCTQLKTIYCNASTPPKVTESIGLNSGCVVIVPKGSVSQYQKAEGWKNRGFIFIDTIPKEFSDNLGIRYRVINFDRRMAEFQEQELIVSASESNEKNFFRKSEQSFKDVPFSINSDSIEKVTIYDKESNTKYSIHRNGLLPTILSDKKLFFLSLTSYSPRLRHVPTKHTPVADLADIVKKNRKKIVKIPSHVCGIPVEDISATPFVGAIELPETIRTIRYGTLTNSKWIVVSLSNSAPEVSKNSRPKGVVGVAFDLLPLKEKILVVYEESVTSYERSAPWSSFGLILTINSLKDLKKLYSKYLDFNFSAIFNLDSLLEKRMPIKSFLERVHHIDLNRYTGRGKDEPIDPIRNLLEDGEGLVNKGKIKETIVDPRKNRLEHNKEIKKKEKPDDKQKKV